jgi:quercetin dioxygenase-like cupin family protein
MINTFELESLGVDINHYFGGGVYAKQTIIPADRVLVQHIHPHPHLSILASGKVTVEANGHSYEYHAPACIVIPAGVAHSVTALTDVVWYCIHATHDTDPETVDQTLLKL